jgi:hypothetical protein
LFIRYIKDYDGGTLMEAYINPEIDYTNLSEIIKKQKETVKEIIHKFLNVKTTHKFSDLDKVLKKHKSDVIFIFFMTILDYSYRNRSNSYEGRTVY